VVGRVQRMDLERQSWPGEVDLRISSRNRGEEKETHGFRGVIVAGIGKQCLLNTRIWIINRWRGEGKIRNGRAHRGQER
jgi:hypothetical protein